MFKENIEDPSVACPKDIQMFYESHLEDFVEPIRITYMQFVLRAADTTLQRGLEEMIGNCSSLEEVRGFASEHPTIRSESFKAMSIKDLIPEVGNVLFRLPSQTFAPSPIKIGEQVLYVFVENSTPERQLDLKESASKVSAILRNKAVQELRKEWLDRLSKKSYCEVLDPVLSTKLRKFYSNVL